jgi:hypothetical protein
MPIWPEPSFNGLFTYSFYTGVLIIAGVCMAKNDLRAALLFLAAATTFHPVFGADAEASAHSNIKGDSISDLRRASKSADTGRTEKLKIILP